MNRVEWRVGATDETSLPEDERDALVALLRALPIHFLLKDETGRYRYTSEHTQSVFAPGGAMAGRTHDQLFPADIADELAAADRRVLETGEHVNLPLWMPDVNGARRHYAIIKFPVAIGHESLIGTIALDLAPFSSAAWEASTYKQILDAITDLVLVKGPKSKLLWANRALQNAYGMSNAELQGILDAPFVEPDMSDRYVMDDIRVFTTGKTLDIPEEPMKWADGQVRAVHTVKSPIFDESGDVKMMVAVIRDITDRKRLELELRQAQKLESLGRLAAGMAHEINTPIQFVGDQRTFAQGAFEDVLGLIESYQQLAAKVVAGSATVADALAIRDAEEAVDLGYLRESLASSFSDMADGVRRIAQLVQALKEFGHPDQGRVEPADINAALRRTVVVATNEYRYVADVVLDLEELPCVTCSISELQQVFLNLIVNAAHAIADKAGPTRGTIRISTRGLGDEVEIAIADTGSGIPAAIQDRIFDPFFTTKGVGRGTGQGLSIARMVVDKHGGTLTFDTVPHEGSTFFVRIPIAPRS